MFETFDFFIMRIILILFSTFFLSFCAGTNQEKSLDTKLRLLILSGSNNHEWQKTTPQLQKMYLESGRFEVAMTESPDTLTYDNFKQFNAIVSNWTAWPEHEYRWPKSTEDGLMQYIEEGGGFVLFHAASATFYDWQEYHELVGSTWGDSTAHGKRVPHKVIFTNKDHPVTKGIADFWITDELWVHSGTQPNLKILAESYSNPENKGRGMMEPVVTWNTLGNGRCFHNILGHDVKAMRNTGWLTLMLRGTEWAATGKVSIPVPKVLDIEKHEKPIVYSWDETDTTFALMKGADIVWQYNFNTQKGKPFFHPVNIGASTITSLSPDDHPWHLGIWHSWKFINGVNYWEYDRENNVKPWNFLGVTEIRNISFEKGDDFSCKIILQIVYHEIGGSDLLAEDRIVTISPPDKNGLFFIDYDFNLTGLTSEVELNRTPLPGEENGKNHGGYAGLSVRFNQDLWQPTYLNPDGSNDDKHGKSMPWKYVGLKDLSGENLGVSIFDHPDNLNYPTPWFIVEDEEQPFYYFSPAPIFNQPHLLKKGERLELKYKMKFYSDEVSKEMLDRDYKNYLKQGKNL